MANILINGLNSKIGGGKTILIGYLNYLKTTSSDHTYYVLTPNIDDYKNHESLKIRIIDIPKLHKISFLSPILNLIIFKRLIRKYHINLIFNLASVPVAVDIPQIHLLQWAYVVYSDYNLWKKMPFKDYIKRKTKLFFIKQNLHYPKIIVVQTETVKRRFQKQFQLENQVEVIPNSIYLNTSNSSNRLFKLPKGTRLLYLTHYYYHKNIEILIPLAQQIKKRNLDFKIITTIDPLQDKKAKKFLKDISLMDLADVICNIGTVNFEDTTVLYKQCNGLLMPTLLETYGLPYLEAMYCNIPIFTSNLDFAKDVCKDVATYFDPLNSNSILESLLLTYSNPNLLKSKIQKGNSLVKSLVKNNKEFDRYTQLMELLLKK